MYFDDKDVFSPKISDKMGIFVQFLDFYYIYQGGKYFGYLTFNSFKDNLYISTMYMKY